MQIMRLAHAIQQEAMGRIMVGPPEAKLDDRSRS